MAHVNVDEVIANEMKTLIVVLIPSRWRANDVRFSITTGSLSEEENEIENIKKKQIVENIFVLTFFFSK